MWWKFKFQYFLSYVLKLPFNSLLTACAALLKVSTFPFVLRTFAFISWNLIYLFIFWQFHCFCYLVIFSITCCWHFLVLCILNDFGLYSGHFEMLDSVNILWGMFCFFFFLSKHLTCNFHARALTWGASLGCGLTLCSVCWWTRSSLTATSQASHVPLAWFFPTLSGSHELLCCSKPQFGPSIAYSTHLMLVKAGFVAKSVVIREGTGRSMLCAWQGHMVEQQGVRTENTLQVSELVSEHSGLRRFSWTALRPLASVITFSFNALQSSWSFISPTVKCSADQPRGSESPQAWGWGWGLLVAASCGFYFLFNFIHHLLMPVLFSPAPVSPTQSLGLVFT